MRKFRKGFTLVELLIVIAILGALSATMTASVTGSTAKAKATAIAANVEACKSAAAMYCAEHLEDGTSIDDQTTTTVLNEYLGTWGDFNSGSIKYAAAENGVKGYKNWYINVDITGDSDHANIIAALEKIKGFGKYGATAEGATSVVSTGQFHVLLWNGKVAAGLTPTP